MERLIIGAPFGNYLQWRHCTATLGTYTREYRGGFWWRLWRVLRTVRYFPGTGTWRNKLGLPNPGIARLLDRCQRGRVSVADKIVSVSARRTEDWLYLLDAVRHLKPLAVELNVSCPNTPGEADGTDYEAVYRRAAVCGVEAIVKLPPLGYERHASLALSQGVLSFHCCNTIPTPAGGISGKPLKPLALAAVRWLHGQGRLQRVVGGGGVTGRADVNDYLDAGATNVAVASALFNPFLWPRVRTLATALHR